MSTHPRCPICMSDKLVVFHAGTVRRPRVVVICKSCRWKRRVLNEEIIQAAVRIP